MTPTAYRILLAICLLLIVAAHACEDSGPLGMITGEIQDWQVTSSSAYPSQWDAKCGERYARLYQPAGYAWCAKYVSASEWLQIDLGVVSNVRILNLPSQIAAQVTGVMVQGRGGGGHDDWVTAFKLSYAGVDRRFEYVTDHYGQQKKYEGNKDAHGVKHYYLDQPLVNVKYIKFHVISWHKHPSMRVEILGCRRCKTLIGLPPYARFSASSAQNFRRGSSCAADDAHFYSSNAWCSKFTNGNQWLQIDIGPATLITGIVTKGRGDTKKRHWVTGYTVSYANLTDSPNSTWTFYREGGVHPKLFEGNIDKYMERYHYFDKPFVARYIRIHPVTWQNHIAMRAGVLGCPFRGECSNEFFKVNDASPCVENLAYKKTAYLNVRRHAKRNAKFGADDDEWELNRATKAVDGEVDKQLHKCTILDNYSTDQPVWMVDLGRKTSIGGVVVLTGRGVEQTPENYMFNVDKITVYVDQNKGRKGTINRSPTNECSAISRANHALYNPRLHFQCDKSLEGRYVYVEPWGVPDRWSHFFNAVLCEVMVYS